MQITGVAQLKARLSQYLAMVKQGAEVVVTERGKVIARIVPDAGGDQEARNDRLRRAGLAKGMGAPIDLERLRRLRPEDPGDSVLRNVLAEREEGW
jgi:prevent-host-death family protein